MSWTLLLAVIAVLGVTLAMSLARRAELARMGRAVREREEAVRVGSAEAQLQHPVIDLSRCLGCGTCVAVCPEDGVLELVHGQAVVVNGARCQGIAACERECPVDAITVTLANVATRNDIPALSSELEAAGVPGLFLAGEVTAHALIRTAIEHGTAVGAEVARRRAAARHTPSEVLDLCVVGAGPAGLACSLEARRHGLEFVTIDQATEPGGTVAKYPRRKLVMSEPVDLPLYGRLGARTYSKEQLIELWQQLCVDHALPIRGGEVFTGVERHPAGHFIVRTETGSYAARHVCLALGRRGVPSRLGVPGEELPKVAYSLLDAHSYQGRRILVVGGGDSAVETAVALAEQPGNQVTLSYRKEKFFRIRSRNETRLQACVAQRRMRVLHRSEVVAIHPDRVDLAIVDETGRRRGELENDDVFIMIGGVPPFEVLERSGVSFGGAQNAGAASVAERGTGLTKALGVGLALALMTLAWAIWHADYYTLPTVERPAHEKHSLLRPGLGAGLAFGVAALALIVVNLLYLARRSPRVRFEWGSLSGWMTCHVATGILALLLALLHGAMAPRETVGGQAFWALAVLLITGAIGRYFYAYVPRAVNGRELELAETKSRLSALVESWGEAHGGFGERAHGVVLAAVERRQWKGTFVGRILALLGVRLDLQQMTRTLERAGREHGLSAPDLAATLALARHAYRTALMTAHYEDLRAVLNSWRFLHRWVALLMVLLVILHVVYALSYGARMFEGGPS